MIYVIKNKGLYGYQFHNYVFIEIENGLLYRARGRKTDRQILYGKIKINRIEQYGDRTFFFGQLNHITFEWVDLWELTLLFHSHCWTYCGKLGRRLIREYLYLLIQKYRG